jgi:large subunit ribosomal protein L3
MMRLGLRAGSPQEDWMKGLIGKKVGMTQIIDESGNVLPVTVIQAGPCYVTQIKTEENDGYKAVQLGYGEAKRKALTQPEAGHLGQLKTSEKHPQRREFTNKVPPLRHLREFRIKGDETFELGQQITVEVFEVGDHVDVVGKSKGRGFAGVMRRHGFGGGPITHGQSDRQRAPGSIGSTSTPGRVLKGMRMAGHMGTNRVTSQNLEVVRIDRENNLLAVKGSVPGHKDGLVVVKEARKQ